MRTTLNNSAEKIAQVRQFARPRAKPRGEIVSEPNPEALRPQQVPAIRSGVPLFPAQPGARPDLELINRLRDDEL